MCAQEGDRLLWVGQCQEDSSVLLASSGGKALHLLTTNKELRPMGRTARGHRVCTSPLLPPPPPRATAMPYCLSPQPLAPVLFHHAVSLHVMPSLDWLPPVETFRFLVQESGYALTVLHSTILHGTFCQCSIPVCWHQECHDHVCACRPWHFQKMRHEHPASQCSF